MEVFFFGCFCSNCYLQGMALADTFHTCTKMEGCVSCMEPVLYLEFHNGRHLAAGGRPTRQLYCVLFLYWSLRDQQVCLQKVALMASADTSLPSIVDKEPAVDISVSGEVNSSDSEPEDFFA